MKRVTLVLALTVLSWTLGACGGGAASSGGGGSVAAYDTDFPLPASVINFTDTGAGSINFQTSISLEDAMAFYRDAFIKAGLTERTITTSVTAQTFSIVFDGDPSGKAIVVQGVALGNGTTNLNIRYEDV